MSYRKPAAAGLITFRQSPLLFVTLLALLLGFYLMNTDYSNEIYNACYRAYAAPKVRRQFGFKMERKRMYYRRRQPLDVFVITGLEPGGVLAKAGVREGDVPVGAHHMGDVAFCQTLWRGRAGGVEVQLINREEYEKLLEEGDLDLFERGHRVVIRPR